MAYLKERLSIRFLSLLLFALTATLPVACASKAPPQETAYQDTETAPVPTMITDIRAFEDDQGTIVQIAGSRMLTFTSVKQADPLGVVFYFPNTGISSTTPVKIPENGVIGGVESTELTTDNKTVRVAINLTRDNTYTVNRGETELEVVFPTGMAADESETMPAAPQVAAAEVEIPEIEMAARPATVEPQDGYQAVFEAEPATLLSGVSTEFEDTHALVRITANGTIQDYTSFALTDPPRIVYDLKNIQSRHTAEQAIAVDSPWLERIRYYSHPDKIRLVLETSQANLSAHAASPTQNGLTIEIGEGVRAGFPNAPVYMAAAGQASDAGASPSKAAVTGWVNKIDFSSETDGKSTIVIGSSETPEYTLEKSANTRLKLTLFDTMLPDYRERPLITTGFESAVDRVTPYMDAGAPNQTFFNIELRESVPYYVEQKGNLLMVHFEASSVPPEAPDVQLALADNQAARAGATAAAAESTSGADNTASRATTPQFTGETISLELYEVDIKNVFRILREVSGLNFAIDKDVAGEVTLSFDDPVPWDQVLELVLTMNRLGKVMEGNIVRIATLDTLTREESERQAVLLAAQKSKEQELAMEPIRTEYIAVSYSNARDEVLPHIQNILTEGRGKADVDERSNLIIVTDTDRVIAQAKEIVQRLDRVTPQVIIEARVVEVNSDVSSELGFDWGMGQNPMVSNELGGTYDWDLAMNFPAASNSGIGFQFARVTGTPFVLDAQLNAIETQSKGEVISSSTIRTLDNKTASIKQGLEVGYYERDDSGGATTAFKNVDLLLEVTPHVTPDNRVSMTVYITKNDIAGEFNSAPLLSTNEETSEFLVNDGETIVIGGIRKKTVSSSTEGFPVLKDVPGLKWLFSNKGEQVISQELLIFITPKIVMLPQQTVE